MKACANSALAEVALPDSSRSLPSGGIDRSSAVNGMARDVVLSDAMMGYLHFIANILAGKASAGWYSNKPTHWRRRQSR